MAFLPDSRPLRRLAASIRQLGWRDSAWLAVARLLARAPGGRCALHRYQFVAQAVAPGSLCRGRGRAITVTPCLVEADLPPGPMRRPGALRERYRQGAQCLVARAAPQEPGDAPMAGWLWLLRDGCLEDEVRVRYALASPESAWDLDVWVHPQQRGGLVFARLWEEANAVLHAQGVRWSCSRISRFNRASLAAHARLGTHALGTATFLRCGGWQWMAASLPPYLHLSRHAGSVPHLAFDTSRLPHYPSLELTCRILKQ
ncbi:hypothetical protein [Janthinobacterium sp. 1_2014MBL_MicDiv]|uniref:hypothetical protein n=1 Tax=Janthinobacterium sp. 1_2014MBL_MicDiv TaxID=1644131 RepID=UPI0008F4B5AC|nr:hypothetical protein [Janthinobacterium sp. 1_2014MBL_MicDiv]APA71363.1 hypothetical protein YQ44_12815 [Janthinobacterium sp. 1_2014MBL_MicDiv]